MRTQRPPTGGLAADLRRLDAEFAAAELDAEDRVPTCDDLYATRPSITGPWGVGCYGCGWYSGGPYDSYEAAMLAGRDHARDATEGRCVQCDGDEMPLRDGWCSTCWLLAFRDWGDPNSDVHPDERN